MTIMDSWNAMLMHIGLDVDLNKDGYICMLAVTPTLHVHMDNTYPLPCVVYLIQHPLLPKEAKITLEIRSRVILISNSL
jgi:hypothetical protein